MSTNDLPPGVMDVEWVHSHEEDTPTRRVFRPRGYAFPPSRGRDSFLLLDRGTLIVSGPGPTDQRQQDKGTWTIAADGRVELRQAGSDSPYRRMRVITVTPQRLVVERE